MIDDGKASHFPRALFPAPLIFVCHFLEESPGFVSWFNAHVQVGINARLFWTVNLTALIVSILVVGFEWFSRDSISLLVAVTWFSFLMLTNGLFHIVAAVVDKQYVPGLVTAILLYIPYFILLFVAGVRIGRVKPAVLALAAVVGSIPMAAHGYLILFKGSRLF